MQKTIVKKLKMDKQLLESILGFILTRAIIFDIYLPLGIAFSAVISRKKRSIFGALGSFLGYLTLSNDEFNLKYAGATLIVIALCNLTKISTKILVFTVITFANLVTLFSSPLSYNSLLMIVVFGILGISSTYFYEKAYEEKSDDLIFKSSMLFFIVSILLSVMNYQIFFDLSPARIFCAFLILNITFFSKNGIISAVILGITVDSSQATPMFTLAYSFAAVISSGLREFNKTIFCSVFLIMYSVGAVFTAETTIFYISLYEVFMACAFFILLPLEKYKHLFETRLESTLISEDATNILFDLSKTLESDSDTSIDLEYNDFQKIFDKTVDDVCKNCKLSVNCWHENFTNSIDALNHMSSSIDSRNYAKSSDFPSHFVSKCVSFPKFLTSINEGLFKISKNAKTNILIEQNKITLAKQYKAMSGVLSEIHKEKDFLEEPILKNKVEDFLETLNIKCSIKAFRSLNGKLFLEFSGKSISKIRKIDFKSIVNTEMIIKSEVQRNNITTILFYEKDKYIVNVFSKSQSKERFSGDTFSHFKTSDSKYFALICDGMGSGQKAYEQSLEVSNLLEKMFKTEVSIRKALNMVNPIMDLKANSDSFVSLDLISIDLLTLEGKIAKQGAMPTYIYRNNKMHRITSKNLPLGLSSSALISKIKFKEGDKILLMSDGVDDVLEEEIIKIFESTLDPQSILNCIFNLSQNIDDKTLMILEIFKNT